MIYEYDGHRPVVEGECFIAPSADIIGKVRLGHESSIWFAVVLRGDNDWIEIGAGSNVQDGSIVHVDPGVPVIVGRHVTIGHGVMLHGCRMEDGCLIGNRAQVLDGAVIGAGSLVAAGALVTPGTVVPPGSVVMGSPGRVVRQVADKDRERMRRSLEAYLAKATEYAARLVQIDMRA